MMRLLGVAVAGLLTASCSTTTNTTPDPHGVPEGVVSQVDAHKDSCADLQVLFDGADFRGDGASMDYIDATMRGRGCYDGEE